MKMSQGQIVNLRQGSPEWLDLRAKRKTASEAPAMAGKSKYQTRDDLLHLKFTGCPPEVSHHQQKRFDDGHQAEELARPIAEEIINDELYPVVLDDEEGGFLASMDGLTMDGEIGFEHKWLSAELSKQIDSGELEDHYLIQLDQQFALSGAKRILFVGSDGTKENFKYLWVERDESRFAAIEKGWAQFERDLAEYSPKEQKVEVVAAAQADLPSPWAEVNGEITITDNLKQFGEALTAYVDGINLKPETDQDFADLDASCKKLKESEQKLTQCEEIALSKLDSVATLRTLISEYREKARQARLIGEKAVKAEKENRKNAIVRDAQESLRKEIESANAEFAPVTVTGIAADFYGAVKGLKTISSMENKCGDELARAKIALTEKRDHIRESLKIIDTAGADYQFLFSDKQQLVDKPHDHLQLLVDKRVDDHKAAEQKRIDDAAAKKAEEIAAAQRKADQEEAERVAKAEREKQQQAEAESASRRESRAQELEQDFDSRLARHDPEAHEAAQQQPTPSDNVRQMSSEKPRVRSSGGALNRPTDDHIISTLSLQYRVSKKAVIQWLGDMDLDSARERMAANL